MNFASFAVNRIGQIVSHKTSDEIRRRIQQECPDSEKIISREACPDPYGWR